MDHAIYPFYKANIHEKRMAAYVVRAVPLILFVTTIGLLVLGVFQYTVILLWVTAILNVAMWLWIVSTACAGIWGSWAVQNMMQNLEGSDNKSNVEGASSSPESQDEVRHIIVIPNYKEDEAMLDETLQSLSEAKGSSRFFVVLGMEARESEAREKAERLKEKHASSFAKLTATFHPTMLEEVHADGSRNPEVPGKASNCKFAVAQAFKDVSMDADFALESSVLTVADADVFLHPHYFDYISKEFASLREAGDDQHKWTLWQSPQLSWRNFYDCPVVSRTWGYISSMWEFGGVSELSLGGHHMVFSAYSLPLQLAEAAQCWDGDIIAEDHHSYMKSFYYGAYMSKKVKSEEKTSATGWQSVKSPVLVHPVMLPAKSTSVNSADGYWATWQERWSQATRHTQGVAEISYALLATWDLLCTLSLQDFSFSFILKLIKVVMKPMMMHVTSTLQAIALATLTLYWLFSGRQVPMCPNTLSVVIPFCLIMFANYRFLKVAFVDPGLKDKKGSLWHAADSGTKPWCGSVHFAIVAMIVVDIALFLGPIMAVYGALAEIIAYWNVCFRGNVFTYVTASKSLAGKSEYGSMDTAKEPPALGAEIGIAEKA
eukprot:TRINITY_DN20676_c0_g1_i1.p1 TRINITY_DN20676_c0_g1~~TRINITY_DN20676_c0_g1_i1.p1  ORF type:complete len:602 (+),score=126.23 TRINITY_DN20676_c0_g1_i1:153-1958(+)